jgi:hypothetical protein
MNTDKLIEAIQILVEQEVKKQVGSIVKQIKKSSQTQVSEGRIQKLKQPTEASKSQLSMRDAILEDDEVQFTKNPILNEILNETKKSMKGGSSSSLNEGYPGMPSKVDQFDEYPTMNNSIPAQMAPQSAGLGSTTGNEALDKALNRDYSQLVKRFNKK